MDDIFFNSLLEDDVTGADGPSGNMFNDMTLAAQYIPSNSHSLGSSKYLKTHDFSPSMDWENAEVSSTCPLEQDSLNDFTGEESSLEASILQELERVTAQFTEKTRICFRDALYRLAENSKQPSYPSQDEDIIMDNNPMLTSDDENLRIEEAEVKELKTNAIDRAVAGLMFSRMNFAEEDNATTEQLNCSLSQQKISYCPRLARLAEDAEVPAVPV
jgi:hypothetical protein